MASRRPLRPLSERRRVGIALLVGLPVVAAVVALTFSELPVAAVALGAVVAVPVLSVVHEAAHLLVGTLLGRRPAAIRLFGVDRARLVRIGSVDVHLGRDPFAGGTVLSHPSAGAGRRLRDAVTVLAGPAADVAVAATWWAVASDASEIVAALSVGVASAATVRAVVSAVPKVWLSAHGPVASDALVLWRLVAPGRPERPSVAVESSVVELTTFAWRADAAASARAARHVIATSREPLVLVHAAALALSAGELDGLSDVCRRVAARPEVARWPVGDRAFLWNLLARSDLLLGDPGLLDEAERHAFLALAAVPCAMTEEATAWVDLRRGRYGSARRSFRRILAAERTPSIRAGVATGLAIAERGLAGGELAA